MMLSSEERKSRLEELLDRVRRNRSRERYPRESAPSAETVAEESPSTVQIEVQPAESHQVDDVPIELVKPVVQAVQPIDVSADRIPVGHIEADAVALPEEDEPTIIDEDAFEKEDDFDEVEEFEDIDVDEEIVDSEEKAEEPVSAPSDDETWGVEPDETVEQPHEVQIGERRNAEEEKRLEVKTFETHPQASGDVGVFRGQREREWTLGAVLERAWRLGLRD